jgi:long-chain acyl-CoA synthetase
MILRSSEQTRYEELCARHLNPVPYAGTMLATAAATWPERVALISAQESWTFIQLYRQALKVHQILTQRTIQPGQRVIIWLPNSLGFYAAYHGAWMACAVVVPLNIFMSTAERTHVFTDCQPSLIITSKAQESSLSDIPAQNGALQVWYIDELAALPEPTADPANHPPCTINPEDMCILLYTSGTTGLPKGVMLSSRAVYHNALQGIARLDPQDGDSVWCALPLFHSLMQNACIWSPCISGTTIIIVASLTRTALLAGLAQRPTVVIAVPALWGLLCNMKKYGVQFDNARYLVSGGDALPSKIALGVELLYGRQLCNGYGLSETSPFIAIHTENLRTTTTCVGKPFVDTQVRIVDAQDQEMTAGMPGKLLVRGPQLMNGYYQAPQATAQIIRPDGWLDTGDLAYVDYQGRIYICGREKDLIAYKGIKIYPQEIENCIMQDPAVTAVGVIGVPDEYGQIPIAYVQATQLGPQVVQRLMMLCKGNLAAYKVPRRIIVMDKLPMTSTGKVNKKQLRQDYGL